MAESTPATATAWDARHGLEGLEHNFLTGLLEDTVKWARRRSIFPATFGLACCAIEMMGAGGPHYDLARFGMEVFRASPRQADLMIVAGRVSQKMAPVLRHIHDQMMDPKWVISMGVCASTGGMFNNYAIVQGVDQVVPVDVYAPGCPPGPETLINAVVTLHGLIASGEITRRRQETGAGAAVHVERVDGQAEPVEAIRRARLMAHEAETQPRSPAPADQTKLVDEAPERLRGVPVTYSYAQKVLHPSREQLVGLVRDLRDDDGYIMCIDVTAVDYSAHPGRVELPAEVEPERFEVVVLLLSLTTGDRLRLRLQVPEDDPVVPSLFDVHPGTEAMEREVFDMFGIRFDDHPDLTRILMPEDWIGHPLRKDYAQGKIPVQFKGVTNAR